MIHDQDKFLKDDLSRRHRKEHKERVVEDMEKEKQLQVNINKFANGAEISVNHNQRNDLKVKSDHRSKFSKLSNWKEEAETDVFARFLNRRKPTWRHSFERTKLNRIINNPKQGVNPEIWSRALH